MKKLLSKLVLVVIGFILALVLGELCLVLTDPHGGFGAARELTQFRRGDDISERFMLDPDMGFRPVLGTDLYNEYGTLTNGYSLAKREGVQRLLFLGDSVTARGFVVEALRRRVGDEGREYWNAGVESFNTIQEVQFYERFNAKIQPDHVILFFHLNDFETTPVVFRTRKGDLVTYAPNLPTTCISPWFFRHSRLYRLFLGLVYPRNRGIDAIIEETQLALKRLRDRLSRDGVQFSVVVLPLLSAVDEWTPGDRVSRDLVHKMLDEQGIRFFDLLAPLSRAMEEGLEVRESPEDTWHPSRDVAERFAGYLQDKGLVEESIE